MRRVSPGKKQTFDLGAPHRSTTSAYLGQRDNLFRASMDLDTSVLDQLTPAVEAAIAQRIYRLGIQARDMARRAAPKKSGALRAGIYVTAPASKVEAKEIRKGNLPKQGRMAGHSNAYARAIQSAAVKRAKQAMGKDYIHGDAYVPGYGGHEDDLKFVTPRTQRLLVGKQAITLDDIENEVGFKAGEKGFVQSFNALLPFNPLGSVGRSAFFVGIGSAMYYSAWVEFGTSKQKAQGFFTPAADWLVSRAPGEVAAGIKEALK